MVSFRSVWCEQADAQLKRLPTYSTVRRWGSFRGSDPEVVTTAGSPAKTQILVVDDHQRTRQMPWWYFEHEGYKVTHVSNRSEVRSAPERETF